MSPGLDHVVKAGGDALAHRDGAVGERVKDRGDHMRGFAAEVFDTLYSAADNVCGRLRCTSHDVGRCARDISRGVDGGAANIFCRMNGAIESLANESEHGVLPRS
jgi:hypothetical protein